MRVVVLGGNGNFGARIVRELGAEPRLDVIAASRSGSAPAAAPAVNTVRIDCHAADFPATLRGLAPDLVIHCAGPFQGQDYRIVRATLAAGAHYLDLADGRSFVTGFVAANQELAMAAGRSATCGASTVPALSSAVVDHLSEPLASLERIHIVIAPGQLASRGVATLAAVFSYLGSPVRTWRDGAWRRNWGWMDMRHVDMDVGRRLGALCDVPDLDLFPARYPGVREVRWHAALEFGAQMRVIWLLAAARRVGVPLPIERLAVFLNRAARWFDPFAGDWGGMRVEVTGIDSAGRRLRRTWQLKAPARDGPEVPCMAAVLLARRMAGGRRPPAGAHVCMGMLDLRDFAPLFERWGIRTRVAEVAA